MGEKKMRPIAFCWFGWVDMVGLTLYGHPMVRNERSRRMWEQIIAEREAALGRKLTPDEAIALWREVRGL